MKSPTLLNTSDQATPPKEPIDWLAIGPPKRGSVCFLINFNRETVFEHTDWKQHFIFGESFILQSKVPPQISTSS